MPPAEPHPLDPYAERAAEFARSYDALFGAEHGVAPTERLIPAQRGTETVAGDTATHAGSDALAGGGAVAQPADRCADDVADTGSPGDSTAAPLGDGATAGRRTPIAPLLRRGSGPRPTGRRPRALTPATEIPAQPADRVARISGDAAREALAVIAAREANGAKTGSRDATPTVDKRGPVATAWVPRDATVRHDLQALRALAVALVVAAHAGVPGLAGGFIGVDVFFVLSGYLITSGLLTHGARGGVHLLGFYARRVRRLAPPAIIVTVTTLVAIALWAPSVAAPGFARDGLWASVWGINFVLAFRATDYHAADVVSPFQHFWSLAVEEQFYLVWPVVVALAFAGLRGRAPRVLVGSIAGAAALGSLAYSAYLVGTDPAMAYFGTHSRVFELSAGALVACAVPGLWADVLPGRRRLWPQRAWMAAGMLGIVGCAVWLNPTHAFPGVLALPVVAATCACLVAGRTDGTWPWMHQPVVQRLGDISYGLYLWHWPLLVVAPWVLGRETTGVERAGLVLASVGLAGLTWLLVEKPVSRMPAHPAGWLPVGATATAAVCTCALTMSHTPAAPATPVARDQAWDVDLVAGEPSDAISAALRAPADDETFTPPTWNATDNDYREMLGRCHAEFEDVAVPPASECAFGDTGAARTAVMVGDSLAGHWVHALDRAGQMNGWRVVVWSKSACPLVMDAVHRDPRGKEYGECTAWSENVRDRIADLEPNTALISHSAAGAFALDTDDAERERVWAGDLVLRAEWFSGVAKHVWFVQGTPQADGEVPQCVADHRDGPAACGINVNRDRAELVPLWAAEERAIGDVGGVNVIATRRALCPGDVCPVVADGVLAYSDELHFTGAWSTYLAPLFDRALPAAQ